MSITYLKGDATSPQISGNKIICHICNDVGGWGKGFVLALSKKWPQPEKDYREWHRDRENNDFALGSVRFVTVEQDLHVANMIGQRGNRPSKDNPPIRYEAVEQAIEKVTQKAQELQASVHMPRIGCGLAGGKWENIEPILKKHLLANHIPTYVYDFA
ncbi:macro domain-containing protein [Candidatus Uabimicrobium amorphum]|uniref:Appr-1-p processing protein n=1 Tax=Uabimicrobium amorphum TaxID=2596890 RepID=A0A5S9ILM1_UABAM|nr:macro domain-containing protein [Candidatus Uabimicrobium amorphum]BBM83984.1 Appr-1-p processing protein [Candidatus Uabimicrobium amorphum]